METADIRVAGSGQSGVSDSTNVEGSGGGGLASVTRFLQKRYSEAVGSRSGVGSWGRSSQIGKYSELGKAIREARRLAGLTQSEVGKACYYGTSWISAIERGVERPSRDMAFKLGALLDIDVVELGEKLGVWPENDWWMSITEAGNFLGVSRTRMYEMVRDGEVPYILVGRWKRLRVSDMAKFSSCSVEDIRDWLKDVRS